MSLTTNTALRSVLSVCLSANFNLASSFLTLQCSSPFRWHPCWPHCDLMTYNDPTNRYGIWQTHLVLLHNVIKQALLAWAPGSMSHMFVCRSCSCEMLTWIHELTNLSVLTFKQYNVKHSFHHSWMDNYIYNYKNCHIIWEDKLPCTSHL